MGNCCAAPANSGKIKGGGGRSPSSVSWSSSCGDYRRCSLHPVEADPPVISVLGRNAVVPAAGGLDLLRRYRLGAELGRGEFGVTRRCEDLRTGEALACKSISKRKLRTAVDVEDVRREVEIMRRLPAHPNVVGFRHAYEDAEAVHLVMELCEGGELFDRIVARGHYGERAAAAVLKTIVEVVQHCHQHGVMHRDLKPENFLFADKTENSPLRVIDFGLSVFFNPDERFRDIVGSPFYMAPEVLKRNYGPEADIWSAGVVLYILLCGVPPFWADTDEGIAQAIVRSVLNLEREPWPKVSDDAKDLVRRMLDPDVCHRLTAKQVLEHPWLKNATGAPDTCLGQAVKDGLKKFSAMNKFKKRAFRVLTEQIPGDEFAGIMQMFDMMDTDKNGNLTLEELKEGFVTIGEAIPDPDVRTLMESADMDGNGTLDCEEFVAVSIHLRRIKSDEHLCKTFSYFDKNNSGFIEIDELREAVLEEGEHGLVEEVVRDIIKDVDRDKDGRISYEEFELMMKVGANQKAASRQCSRVVLKTLSLNLLEVSSQR